MGQPMLLGTLTASTAAIVLSASEAQAKDASEIAEIAQAITVRIEGATQGSGVLIKKEGNRYTVLTAWHVIKDNLPEEEVGIITSDGKEHVWESKSLQRLGKVDMAVLTFKSKKNYQTASIGDIKKVKYQDQVYVAGFPLLDRGNLKFDSGEVVANAEVSIEQGYQLLYSNKTKPGMSGGVILDKNGELVGIHGRGEVDEKVLSEKELIVKTGVNQGVPITFYRLFNSGLPVVLNRENPTTADDYFAQAKASQGKDGRQQTVIRLINESLKIKPDNSAGYFLRAFTKFQLNKYQEAVFDYNLAIQFNPKDTSSYYNRGIANNKLKNDRQALIDFADAIEIDATYFLAYYAIGFTKQEMGRDNEAIENFNKAIEIDPNFVNAYYARGYSKQNLGENRSAIVVFDKAIQIDPGFSDAYHAGGVSYFNLRKFKIACRYLKESTNLGNVEVKEYLNHSDGSWCRNMPN